MRVTPLEPLPEVEPALRLLLVPLPVPEPESELKRLPEEEPESLLEPGPPEGRRPSGHRPTLPGS